jgi:hypothetical protein
MESFMRQEWDYPPSRKWQTEIVARPRFERVVDHADRKPTTAWKWYTGQMRGRGSWLYKANVSALYFTGVAALLGIGAVVGLVVAVAVSGRAHAESGSATIEDAAKALTTTVKPLGYHVTFKESNCAQGANYVCDITATSGKLTYKFTAVSKAPKSPVDHFDMPIAGDAHLVLPMVSYAVVSSFIGDVNSSVEIMTPFLTDEIWGAKIAGGMISDPYRGTQQTITILPVGVAVTVAYQQD